MVSLSTADLDTNKASGANTETNRRDKSQEESDVLSYVGCSGTLSVHCKRKKVMLKCVRHNLLLPNSLFAAD